MHKAEVADHVHNPEILVASGRFHDLFGGGQFNKGRVFQLRADRNDVLGVILHRARGILRYEADGRNDQQTIDNPFQMVHSISPLLFVVGVDPASARGWNGYSLARWRSPPAKPKRSKYSCFLRLSRA